MTLENEVIKGRKEIVPDGYEMSFGEVMSLYKEKELIINPNFQRLFRWTERQKSRFIESLLLGIPIPPIFVFQNEDGVWELIDGLQRLSTVFEFTGILRIDNQKVTKQKSLLGTKFLPSLSGKCWEPTSNLKNGIGKSQQLEIKRARIRVEILKKESDPLTKYELFQRLNTGGTKLSEQEVRNCTAVMLNEPFFEKLKECAKSDEFLNTLSLTPNSMDRQFDIELVLRFIAFRNIKYDQRLDVHEYLDNALMELATSAKFSMKREEDVFDRTFTLINKILGKNAFKRWDGNKFQGKFLLSVFELLAIGISKNIKKIEALPLTKRRSFITKKAKEIWTNEVFKKHSGAGISGSSRIAHLLPISEKLFRP